MKKVDRIMKKNTSRLNKYYKKNRNQIINIMIDILFILGEDYNIIRNIICYNGIIPDQDIKKYHDDKPSTLGFTDGLDIHIFMDRIINYTVFILNSGKNKRHLLYRVFVYEISLILFHEFYHIKERNAMSEEEYLQKCINIEELGMDENSENYANKNAYNIMDLYISYIFRKLKI